MKLLTLLAMSLFSLTGLAVEPPTVVSSNKAVIQLCADDMMGCTVRIEIDGSSYLLETASPQAEHMLLNVKGAYAFSGKTTTAPGYARGTIEHGSDNPSSFDVFKATYLSFGPPTHY